MNLEHFQLNKNMILHAVTETQQEQQQLKSLTRGRTKDDTHGERPLIKMGAGSLDAEN